MLKKKMVLPWNEIRRNIANIRLLREKKAPEAVADPPPAHDEKTATFLDCSKEVNEFIHQFSEELIEDVSGIQNSMDRVSLAASELAKGAIDNCESIEQANSSSKRIMDSVQKVTGNVMVSVDMLKQANTAIEQGRAMIGLQKEAMEQNGQAVERLASSMEDVRQKAASISHITRVLDDIAQQTNLLSLNASIEAARVGKLGSGFGVVAQEIRKLAADSKKQAVEISRMTLEINEAIDAAYSNIETSKAVALNQNQVAEGVTTSFHTIAQSVAHVDNDINTVLVENRTLEEHMKAVQGRFENISAVSQQTAASTEEVSGTIDEQATHVRSAALKVQELNNMAVEMKRIIEDFFNE